MGPDARLDAMSPAKRALFERRLARRRTRPDDEIVPVPRSAEIPLSSAQRRLWFMDQLSPGSAMFNVPVALRLTGPLRLDVLTDALRTLFARHESLRTVFATGATDPVQRILPELEVDPTPVPLDPGAELETVLAAEAARPFSLEHGPLVRTRLIRLADADHVLLVTLHHSVCDGLSVGIVVGDLLALYRAGATGAGAGLATPPVQYADYAGWEARPSRAAALAEDLEYWRGNLRGAPPVIELPLDHPRPATQSFRGACHRFTLPFEVWKPVQQLAQSRRTTPYVVLLAGFAGLLSRYSADDEVCVATPVANRPRVELEKVVGFFTNSIALRVDTSGDPTFEELVDRTREVVQHGLARSGVPFERVVEAVDPVRSLGHAPVAQVSFAMVDDPAFDTEVGGVRIRPVAVHTGAAKYDLTLELWPGADDRLHGTVEYATDLFEEATVARLVAHFGSLLDTLAAAPDMPVPHARLVSDADMRELVAAANRAVAGTGPAGTGPSATELIERQARETPELAGQLRSADRLACALRAEGAGPGTRVGLLLERDTRLAVAALATLRAGAAYLWIDVADPEARRAEALADADVRVVVTDRAHAGSLRTDVRVVPVDHVGDGVVGPPARPLPAHPAHLRHVPGSGALVSTHGELARHVAEVIGTGDLLTALVPPGRLAGTSRLVLDPTLTPVGPGMVGELHVGAAGGYHDRPALTAERFVPDPFATTPGGRLYRTGEIVRLRADNGIEHPPRPERAAGPADRTPVAGFTAPATPLEERIAAVWAEVLGVPSVSRDASFGTLGGHSLLATRAVARLRDALGIDLPLRVFLRADTLADLAAAIDGLEGRPARPAIGAATRPGPAPLSYAQGRLYFLHRLAGESSFYNVPIAFRLDGALDRDAFRAAFAALWERHEGLRTRFPAPDGDPVQEIMSASGAPYTELDLRAEPDPHARLDGILDEEARQQFDLAAGPLARGVLARLGPDAHVFALTLHHVVSDGWSVSVLLDELMTLYRAFAAGEPSPLTPLPVTYVDYTHWQRSWLTGAELETQLDYWRTQLADVPTLHLPTDRPRPAVQTYRGARHRMTWSPELSRAIGELGRREGVSLFMVLLAGFDVLLARSSGQRDVTVGTPVANRTATELEGLVGCFANTLALRVDLSGDPDFAEVLRRVRTTAQDAYAHQDVPFDLVVDAVAPERSLSHSPLFQVRFALQSQPRDDPDPGSGLRLEMLHREQRTARFDLVVDVWETGAGLEGVVEYSTDLFDEATVAALMTRYEVLLERLVHDPAGRVFGVDLLSPADRRRLDALSRGPEPAAGADELTFVRRFHEQAARRPDAPAVTCGEVTLSYGELRRRAGGLARVLAARGVAPEALVGVHLDRGVDLVVAILAVLEAGGAYLTLDPGYPDEHVAAIVRDARPALVLTSRTRAGSAPAGALPLEDVAGGPGADVMVAVAPDHPAYVVYTSGTSGTPKGVVVTHRGLAGYLSALPTALELPAGPAFLHTASFAFSSSVRQLAVPLALGGRVVIAEREHLAAADRLLGHAAAHDVDVLDLVPSHLRAVEPAMARGDWRPRVLLTASEPLRTDLAETVRRAPGESPRWVNMYGQTETTGIVATAPVGAEREGRGAVVPLGRPIPGARVYVVDDDLRPVPPGHPGELLVGGTGLARGYLGDPARTAERFVPDPFGPPGGRLYRTGDRGRFLPSGKVEFLGRVGDQVKVRGHRVEPQDVASVLSALDGVGECEVLCVEESADDRRLVAYTVLRGTATATSLRAALRERLPGYMVPTLQPVDALPRLPNGKVDRGALLAGSRPRPAAEAAGKAVRPSGAATRARVAETLTAIWQEVLHRQDVHPTDDFYELGGDSLHVIRVVDRARNAGISITPAQFIANPTIAGLSSLVAGRAGAAAPETARAGEDAEIPLLPTHHAFLRRNFEDHHLYTHVFMFEPATPLDPALMEQAVRRLVAHHEALRISFPRDGGTYRIAVREPFDPAPFTSVDLSALDPAAQDAAFTRLDRTLHRKLDYGNGPLLQFALVRFGRGRPDRFVAIVHHQLMDNSSWGVLLDDLQAAYTALAAGTEPALTPATASFGAWARNLAALARSRELDADIAYWTRLAMRPVPRMPLDFPDGGNRMPAEQTVTVRLGATDTAALRRMMPRRYGLSLNDALLAAVLRGYGEWAGQDAILVDMVARGRELGGDLDLSRAIGRFSVTAPRLLELPQGAGPDALLASVAEQVRAMPRGGLGYGLLRHLDGFPAIGELLGPLDGPDILLSNWGELDQIFDESALLGPPADDLWRSPGNGGAQPDLARMHRLVINAGITGGELELNWRYSADLHRRESIDRLAALVTQTLAEFARVGSGDGVVPPRPDGRTV
ncbi:amino acid adenylation domain-containing protein [Plantactinospora sp. WMMB334]|uniref:amino acid adenylation domain-containing protein n=1 Tax=Plantactinospora sp. WMMB334 TaxID=3404119 RepID=UPI003B944369